MPWFWIVAGPNGAGKTTLVSAGVVARAAGVDLISLNADARTAEILAAEPDAPDANLRAAIDTDARVAACIARWSRSIGTFGRLLPQAHEVFVFDNSSTDGPVLIARKTGGRITHLQTGRIPEIDTVLRANGAA